MNQRVRAAVILPRGSSLLLVLHVDPETGAAWWVPPGGGLEETDETVLQCALRETTEETGLYVRLGKLVYLREFCVAATHTRHLELFFLGDVTGGALTTANVRGTGPDEHMIREVRWVERREMAGLTIYPEHLAVGFWDDLERGFPEVRYLGAQLG